MRIVILCTNSYASFLHIVPFVSRRLSDIVSLAPATPTIWKSATVHRWMSARCPGS